MKRTIALTLNVLLPLALGCASLGNATTDDRQSAFAGMADIETQAFIARVDDARLGGHPAFLHAAQRALHAAAERPDHTFYQTPDGDSVDGNGPLGNVDRFMYRHARTKIVALDAPLTMDHPASYTMAQAKAGLTVYAANCLTCHGADLNGGSAPAVAGTQFLTTVKSAKWTLTDLRNLVVKMMPLYVPATLTPKQYSDVLTFLLASNCYPAGNIPFPQKDEPAFGMVRLGPIAGARPTDTKLGTCVVR